MLLSMTGQGSAREQEHGLSVLVEIRTVNNRYYKLVVRASEGYGALEHRLDEIVRNQVRRGTVQLDVRVERQAAADDYQINEVVLASYVRQLQAAAAHLEQPPAIHLERLLELPGVVEETGSRRVDADSDWPLIQQTVRQALQSLTAMRAEEGQTMKADLTANCRTIREHLEAIEARAPLVVEQYRSRIMERVNKLLAEFEVRVEAVDVIREVALFAERSDIAEEIVRLRSHLDQFVQIMQLTESSGRKLEFVTQEMFREANTIGSKSNDADIAHAVIEIKAAVERIREMIQNVE